MISDFARVGPPLYEEILGWVLSQSDPADVALRLLCDVEQNLKERPAKDTAVPPDPPPVVPSPAPKPPPGRGVLSGVLRPPAPKPKAEWERFVSRCDEVLSAIEDLPERADEFREGVEPKVEGMKEWAESHQHVTDAMETALDNIDRAVSNWLRRD